MEDRTPEPTSDARRRLQERFHSVMAIIMMALPIPIYAVALSAGRLPPGHPWPILFFEAMGLAHLTSARAKRQGRDSSPLQYLFLIAATLFALGWLQAVKSEP